jgi:hypothetical protein
MFAKRWLAAHAARLQLNSRENTSNGNNFSCHQLTNGSIHMPIAARKVTLLLP